MQKIETKRVLVKINRQLFNEDRLVIIKIIFSMMMWITTKMNYRKPNRMDLSNTVYLWALLYLLIRSWYAQIVLDGTPSTTDIFYGEITLLTIDGELNSINGASWIQSFELSSNSPDQPSWVSNSGLDLIFNPMSFSDIGTYELQYEVIETGIGSCNFVPHNRRIMVNVKKKPPVINYIIPDYNNMRAAIYYEIIFPDSLWIDPHGTTLTYNLLTQSDTSPPNNFIYDTTGNTKIYGTTPNSMAGTYYLRIQCIDLLGQRESQDFTMYFAANNNPYQFITDLSVYAFEIAEGVNSLFVIPSGIYRDPDGDSIEYELCYFENFQSLSTVTWATFYSGIEGVSYIDFVNPTPTTHTGFNFLLSDGIGSTTGPILINFAFNESPTVSSNPLNITIYPNTTVAIQIDLSTYFTDPEGASLTYSSHSLPSEVTTTALTSSNFKIDADFTSAFPSSDMTFYFQATDGASKPTDLQVTILS
jgi:hypothetical protein